MKNNRFFLGSLNLKNGFYTDPTTRQDPDHSKTTRKKIWEIGFLKGTLKLLKERPRGFLQAPSTRKATCEDGLRKETQTQL